MGFAPAVVARLLLALAVVAAAVLAPGLARAATPLTPCGKTSGLECTQVVVPLDRSGTVPGTISLHVEVLPPRGTPQGVFFLIAGGPGQGSTRAFDLRTPNQASYMQEILPGYTLVAVDNRGTGASGLIDCPGLQTATLATVKQEAELARDCANLIGPSRVFYSTRDHAADLESVREALGFGKIALYGVSYGTKLALAYALAYPDEVSRLLLDSVVPPNEPDPYQRNLFEAMPQTLASFCAGGRCRGATPNYPGDVAAVANRLEAHPARGTVVTSAGRKKTVRVNGEDLVSAIIDTDLNAGLGAEMPAAVHAARSGYLRPLLRLVDLDRTTSADPAVDLSWGLYAATTCADGDFPWSPSTPVDRRQSILNAAISGLPAGSFGPFGNWAARTGSAYFCELWPSPVGQTPLAPGPYPDVPVLAVSGGLDLRTPTANARAVIQNFPHGQLLVTPGVGHSVLGTDLSFCSQQEVRYWVQGLIAHSTCPRAPALVRTLGAFPRSRVHPAARSTLALAAKTVNEAEAAWGMTVYSSGLQPPGLYGGKLVATQTGFRLVHYSVAPGVQLSGSLRSRGTRLPLPFRGTLTVSGARAARGTVHVSGTGLSGVLGGHRVAGRL